MFGEFVNWFTKLTAPVFKFFAQWWFLIVPFTYIESSYFIGKICRNLMLKKRLYQRAQMVPDRYAVQPHRNCFLRTYALQRPACRICTARCHALSALRRNDKPPRYDLLPAVRQQDQITITAGSRERELVFLRKM